MNRRSPDHIIVTFEGPDAASFLQSQLTQDVNALAIGGWQWQGYCSAKGRLQATFALARGGATTFWAVLHESVAAPVVKRFTMFRMRAKLSIEASASLAAYLHLGPTENNSAPQATLDLGHGRTIYIAASSSTAVADDAFMQQWNRAGIEAMQPEVTLSTTEMFVPQMLNWDHVQPGGGVSFSKGCYPGQEVVARAHYRGAVKRMLELQTLPANADASHAPGSQTALADGRSAEICNSVPEAAPSGAYRALVVVAPQSEPKEAKI
jgi:tRNA-modifying protein YgfZ